MDKEILKLIGVDRDAVAINRGFYYQYLSVLDKWVDSFIIGQNLLIHTKVGDDIREVGGSLIFTQVKCYSSAFSLRSPEIRKALFNFFFI